jgi:hypothetical protein
MDDASNSFIPNMSVNTLVIKSGACKTMRRRGDEHRLFSVVLFSCGLVDRDVAREPQEQTSVGRE